MRKSPSKILRGMLLTTSGLVASTLIASTAALAAGPSGGSVAVGSATITNSSPTQTVINQTSKKALINWDSFSVSSGSSVTFNQPNKKSLTVNRVTGPNASAIDGQILANGSVWLINANGILFGKGSQINVGALLATTSDLNDDDFKNGKYTFQSAANPNAGVVNQGTITAGRGGSVVLSAPMVSNEGLIKADLGSVVLGGAKAFTVDMDGDNLLRYQITAPVDSAPKDRSGSTAAALVSNAGNIEAAGGRVMMTARAARNVQDNVINNTGMVEATSVSSHNGEIDLDAGDGTVNDTGTLDASGTASGQTGGAVNVTGGNVNVADGAKINVSGNVGGGTVQIGGGLHGQGTLAHAQNTIIGKATISADAVTKGNGGTVAVWSDNNTNFAGTISARGGANGGNGGQVETSGHNLGVANGARVDAGASLGLVGDWLLDPAAGSNLILTSCVSQSACCGTTTCADTASIISSLSTNNVTEQTGGTLTLDSNSDITWSSGYALSLLAQGGIDIESSIQNGGTGALNLIAGWNGLTSPTGNLTAAGTYGLGGSVSIAGITPNSPIYVGSKGGTTTVAGQFVTLTSDDGATQIGYHGGGATGNINVQALAGGVNLDATNGYAQIGHGGAGTSGSSSGNITVNSIGGDVNLIGGDSDGAYAQIGHGGDHTNQNPSASFSLTGNISVTGKDVAVQGGGGGESYAQIGHGGEDSGNDPSTAITEIFSGNITVLATNGSVDVSAGVSSVINMGEGSSENVGGNSYAQIGHEGAFTGIVFSGDPGVEPTDIATGNINVHAVGGSVTVSGDGGGAQGQSDYALIGHGGDVTQGSQSGDIQVIASGDITLNAGDTQPDDYGLAFAQIGNGGGKNSAGASGGNITINAGGDLNLNGSDQKSSGSDYVQIGNGSVLNQNSSGVGPASGNISITVSGTTTINSGEGSDSIWIGNIGGTGNGASSGPVSLITGVLDTDSDNQGDFGTFLAADLVGGDVFVGLTGTSDETWDGLSDYNSSHAFTLATSGNLSLQGNIQNSGSGNVNIVAGWNGHTTDLTSLKNSGVYGNNGGNLSLSAGEGIIAIGSKSGITTVEANEIDLVGDFGAAAQIGYHGADATGAINVLAYDDISITGGEGGTAQIGNGGSDVTGNVRGDISVVTSNGGITVGRTVGTVGGGFSQIGNSTAGGTVSGNITVATSGGNINVETAVPTDVAEIGNLGFNDASESGDININTHGGAINVLSPASGDGMGTAYAQIGNWTDGSSTGTSFGNITINAGDINVIANGTLSSADIGNGNYLGAGGSGAIGGNITINATSLTVDADEPDGAQFEEARVGNLGKSNITGNLVVTTTGDVIVESIGAGAASIGNFSNPGSFDGTNFNETQGLSTANVTVNAGGNVSVSSDGSGAYASIENGGASSGSVNVTAAGNVILSASEGAGALIGTLVFGNGGNNVAVTSTNGRIEVDADGALSNAQIGNEAAASSNGTITPVGAVTGNVTLTALNATNGKIIASASTDDTDPVTIGNTGLSGGSVSGNLVIKAGNLFEDSDPAHTTIGNAGGAETGNVTIIASAVTGDLTADMARDLTGGDFTLGTTSATNTLQIGNLSYSSNHTLSLLSAGDLTVASNIQNSGTGNIMLVAGWNPSVSVPNVGSAAGTYGNNNGTVLIGGSGASGNSAVGSAGGTTTIFTRNLNISAVHGTAEVGYAGAGHGDIVIAALGNITAVGASSSAFALIGNLGTGSQAVSGNITIADAGGLTLTNAILGDVVLGTSVAAGNTVLTAASLTTSGATVLSGSSADITLTGAGAGVGTAANALNTVVSAIAIKTNNGNVFLAAPQNSLSIGVGSDGINLGTGNLTLTAGGSITQTAAIEAASVNLSSTGSVSLMNAANAFGTIILSANGSAAIGDSTNLTVAGVTVGGDLQLFSKGDITVIKSIQASGSGNVTVVAGWNGVGTSVGSGTFGNNGGDITIGGPGASGGVAVGSKSGTTTLAGANINLLATNGYAQIGYHGGGSGAVNVFATGNISLSGGGSPDFFAQIGDGGFNVSGSSSAAIIVQASGDIALDGGAGQEAYAQIGNGGAESNSNSSGYSETGIVTVSGENVVLAAGSGNASYAQIGHGGYKSGQALNGIATLGGAITVNSVNSVKLTGGGADAYAQIGNGGDFLNVNVADGSSGTVSGDIVVNVASPIPSNGDPVTVTAGSGANSYSQIGNGGQGENTPVSGGAVTFAINGDVTVSDLLLTGSNTGANGYAQIGNGDASKTGTGDVSGIVLVQGTQVTSHPGTAPGASAGVGNDTGVGTVTGTSITGEGETGVNDPGTQGSIASTIQNPNSITNFNITQVTVTPSVLQPGDNGTNVASEGPTPLEQLADSSDSEGDLASDTVSDSIGKSLDGKSTYVTSKTLIPGLLKQIVAYGATNPHGVPPADEDYSSWGNEAFWRW